MNRTKAQSDGFLLLCLGVLVFLVVGIGVRLAQRDTPMDVRMLHACTRCVIDHCDPYNADDVASMYLKAGGPSPSSPGDRNTLRFESMYVYLPTIFIFTAPIARLPFAAFYLVWVTLVAGSFLLSALLVWDIGRTHAPLLTGALLGFYLVNSGSTISAANPGSLAVSLCIVSVWCFFSKRFEIAGAFCLAASLAIKPHDSGLVWLFLIALGGEVRKRALQGLLIYVCLSLPILLWMHHASPHWIPELQTHLATLSAHGAVSDAGPSTVFRRGALMITNLQSAVSLIRDDPSFYNPTAYVACLLIFATAVYLTLRFRPGGEERWLAMASVAALSMLPIYHRLYDSKLCLLTIPACALLSKKGGRVANLSLLMTASALIVTSELPWAFYLGVAARMHATAGALLPLLIASVTVPIPATLLIVSVFYLWVYRKQLRTTAGFTARTDDGSVRVAQPWA